MGGKLLALNDSGGAGRGGGAERLGRLRGFVGLWA